MWGLGEIKLKSRPAADEAAMSELLP